MKRELTGIAVIIILFSTACFCDQWIIKKELIEQIKVSCGRSYPYNLMLKFVAEGTDGFDTAVGRFEATDIESEALLSSFHDFLKPQARFIDLGSGDGRVVFLAALFGAKAYGIEYDARLIDISREAQKKLKDIIETDKVNFIQGDFLKHDLSQYDIMYLCAGTNTLSELIKKVVREIKPGGVLISLYPGEEEIKYNSLIFIRSYKDKGNIVNVYQKNNKRE